MKGKVSCITPTLGVLPKLKIAIDCYLKQTYTDKEILILFYDHDIETKEYLTGLDKEWRNLHNIRIFHYTHDDSVKLGAVINFLISKSTGDFIAIWDSDDFHSPYRIENQLTALITNDKDSCTLAEVLVYSYKHKEVLISNNRATGWEQTLLCKVGGFPVYENHQTKYDTPVLEYFVSNDKNHVLNNKELYCYTIYGNNVSSNSHIDSIYKTSSVTHKKYIELIKILDI